MLQAIVELILEFVWEWVLAGRYWRFFLSMVLAAACCAAVPLCLSDPTLSRVLMIACLLFGIVIGLVWQTRSG